MGRAALEDPLLTMAWQKRLDTKTMVVGFCSKTRIMLFACVVISKKNGFFTIDTKTQDSCPVAWSPQTPNVMSATHPQVPAVVVSVLDTESTRMLNHPSLPKSYPRL